MTLPTEKTDLQATIATLRERLLAARGPQGYWEGHLSSSALSTATAVFALAVADREKHSSLTDRGLQWLCQNQNADGGWGDTVQSPSNLSTTMLCYSALAVPDCPLICREAVARTETWLHRKVGSLKPQALAKAVARQYGKDRTFSVPILTMCALAGRLGTGVQAWRLVRPLPFELAVLPHRLYKWLRLPVVSYALPALIAIGQARYEHRKPRNPLTGALRRVSRAKSLDVLKRLQPENGGFLEAAPLTSFVVMSLAASGHRDHEVVSKGVEFLAASIRDDGSWPIDTNLATWVTTLSISALSNCGLLISGTTPGNRHPPSVELSDFGLAAAGSIRNPKSAIRNQLTEWLLCCQHRDVHPYTHAEPGGWAWSNLPGAVPDADDTAGALIALHELSPRGAEAAIANAVSAGVTWLLGLQNSDGGIPTFCRGWTKLPFDKSSPDITAHALGAMGTWLGALSSALRHRTEKAMGQAVRYLQEAQRADGSWVPLWFGNQHNPKQENPVYGTSRALTHLSRLPESYVSRTAAMQDKAVRWLLSVQNTDGGWGGAGSVVSTIEETALAVDALATTLLQSAIRNPQSAIEAVCRSAEWLIRNTDRGRSTPASPIGLYFARLWYFEELYPIIFALSALSKVQRLLVGPCLQQ
ncbi:MAG: squalene--hopene cyclase [Phycisphaerae bacterium]|nr:squalene--hopene cyclase [Phycisphaerae bacterium]